MHLRHYFSFIDYSTDQKHSPHKTYSLTKTFTTVKMGNATSTNAIANFSKFESLAKELRLQIWEEAVESLEPAFIVIRCYPPGTPFVDESSSDLQLTKKKTYGTRASAPVPAVLQANQEARELVLKRYRLMFANAVSPGPPQYFNPDKDRLHLCNVGPSHYHQDVE